MPSFSHLHCHSQFSLLDGASPIDDMFAKAKADGMRAVALTDHGNMYGAFKFVNSGERHGVKPIVGCEFYMVADRFVFFEFSPIAIEMYLNRNLSQRRGDTVFSFTTKNVRKGEIPRLFTSPCLRQAG
jgi:DNA polymerase III alpha subunit